MNRGRGSLARAARRLRGARGRLASTALSVRTVRAGRARVQRSWAGRPGATTLILANPYRRTEGIPDVASFAARVEALSEGRIRIAFMNGWTSRRDRDEERTVLDDVAGGLADLGWVGARAVGAVFGIRSLDALDAPLLFPDEDAVGRFAAAAAVAPLLSPLQEVGLVGIGLLAGGLRRPFGITGPLISPDDWHRKVIRTHASLLGEASVRALGATPVLRSTAELSSGPPPGVDGMDLDLRAVKVWRYPGWLTWNVPLWPRFLLLAGNRRRLERLSSADGALLRAAARLAAAEARGDTAKDIPESVRLVEASEQDLKLLRRELRPVYDELRSHADSSLGYVERALELVSE